MEMVELKFFRQFSFKMMNKFYSIQELVHLHKSFLLIDHYHQMENIIGKYSCQQFMEHRLCLVLLVSE